MRHKLTLGEAPTATQSAGPIETRSEQRSSLQDCVLSSEIARVISDYVRGKAKAEPRSALEFHDLLLF